MSKKIFITDDSFNTGDNCTRSYYVELKLSSESDYQEVGTQYESPVVVEGLEDDQTYNVRITRTCCDGTLSAPVVVTVLTTQLAAPTGFNAAATGATTTNSVWDAVTNATAYELQRGLLADYSDAEVIYTGALRDIDDTGLTTATTYYYRVRAFAATYLSSNFSNDSVTTS